ncbi:MAG: chemotaxis protein CheC [Leptospiraceae bacterium]|nr:hypothetical protein [Leptospiraceae bacterium]MCP5492949.1 chemotaxis protein CheC [Leptospiraceae bacterium]
MENNSKTINLAEIEQDALIEGFNIGIGRAAKALSEMVDEKIKLSVPELKIFTKPYDLSSIGLNTEQKVCAIVQNYNGKYLKTDAMLLFVEEKSLELVRLFLREDIPLEDITELEEDALSEIGNIILNACIGSLSNLIDSQANGSLPKILKKNVIDLITSKENEESVLLIIYVDFSIENKSITGYVIFTLNMINFQLFLNQLVKSFTE